MIVCNHEDRKAMTVDSEIYQACYWFSISTTERYRPRQLLFQYHGVECHASAEAMIYTECVTEVSDLPSYLRARTFERPL